MIKAVIVDDELCFREMIRMLLKEYFPDIRVAGEAEGVEEAIRMIEEQKPNLVFLDIELKDGKGFHVLQKLNNRNFKLIVITAFNEYAIQAIKFSAIDYMLKPINEFEFKAGVEKAMQEIGKHETPRLLDFLFSNYRGEKGKKLVLRTTQDLHVVDIADIVRCEADNVYTTFFLATGEKIVVSKGLGEYVELLECYGFIRPHQSHLVNLGYIKKLDKTDGGFLILKDKAEIPVSARRKQHIIEILNRL